MASTFPTVNCFCLVLLCGRAGRLTAQNGGSRRGQGGKLWAGARGYACSDCCEGGPDGDTSLMSNDKSIVPALSATELAYQCNGTAPPCKLHWHPGKNILLQDHQRHLLGGRPRLRHPRRQARLPHGRGGVRDEGQRAAVRPHAGLQPGRARPPAPGAATSAAPPTPHGRPA